MTVDWTLDDLHETLVPVAEVIGLDGAADMVRLLGGMRVHVSKTYGAGHPLAPLGEERARRMIEGFAGEVLTIPVSLVSNEARARKVRQLSAEGCTVNEIVRRVGCGYRFVQEARQGRAVIPRGRRVMDSRQIDIEDILGRPGARRA